jgi:hypothetical protein
MLIEIWDTLYIQFCDILTTNRDANQINGHVVQRRIRHPDDLTEPQISDIARNGGEIGVI